VESTDGFTVKLELQKIDRRTLAWFWIALAGAGSLALAILFFFDPARVPIYPLCVFHQLTGLDCPGCGSLRALHALLHGRLVEALHFNALTIASLPLLAWAAIRFARSRFADGPSFDVRPFWLWLYLSAWIVFGILRLLNR
jgi:uncharacterized protein DUF2752